MSFRLSLEPIIRPLMKMHWRRVRGMTLGVRGLVLNEGGQVCLVRHTYMPGWHLPGGGVERGETVWQAIEKELREEAGVQITAPPELFSIYSNEQNFRGDHVALFVARAWTPCPAQPGQEIAEIGWFSPDQFPPQTTRATLARLAEVLHNHPVEAMW